MLGTRNGSEVMSGVLGEHHVARRIVRVAQWVWCWIVVLGWLALAPKHALALERESVPAPLQSWVPWVLDGYEAELCPKLQDEPQCAWPGKLTLQLDSDGGRFELLVTAVAPTRVSLPGAGANWPIQVALGGNPVVVLERANTPVVELPIGQHRINGQFSWSKLPESLSMPSAIGIVELFIDNKQVRAPRRDQTSLWLSAEHEEAARERLDIEVFRLLEDATPFRVTTRIDVQVSGRAREVDLGKVQPEGSQPWSLEAPIPVRIDPEGHLLAQLRAGDHSIELVSAFETPPGQITVVQTSNLWPKSEVWAWVPDANLRQVSLSGLPAVDPNRTNLPEAWRSHSAFAADVPNVLNFTTERRGAPDAVPNQLSLERDVWLDISGAGYTIRDRFTGQMNRGWRLELQSGELGRASITGQDTASDLLITQTSEDSPRGVELRSAGLNLTAESRSPYSSTFRAVGWSEGVDKLSIDLHLPPGWDLFNVSGADRVSGTWVSSWQLFDFFFVLVVCLATAKLLGAAWGLVALGALVLSHQQSGAPYYLWGFLLAFLALVRVVRRGRGARALRVVFAMLGFVLVLMLVGFAVQQVRVALYPQLSHSDAFLSGGMTLSTPEAEVAVAPSHLELDEAPAPAMKQEAPLEDAPGAGMGMVRKGARGQLNSLQQAVGSSVSDGKKVDRIRQASLMQDPDAVVQTGPGIPDWHARTWHLNWSGPVDVAHELNLQLISPNLNRLLTLLRLGLLGGLAYALLVLGRVARFNGRAGSGAATPRPSGGRDAMARGGRRARSSNSPPVGSPPASSLSRGDSLSSLPPPLPSQRPESEPASEPSSSESAPTTGPDSDTPPTEPTASKAPAKPRAVEPPPKPSDVQYPESESSSPEKPRSRRESESDRGWMDAEIPSSDPDITVSEVDTTPSVFPQASVSERPEVDADSGSEPASVPQDLSNDPGARRVAADPAGFRWRAWRWLSSIVLMTLCWLGHSPAAQAQMPSGDLLSELRDKLLEPPECGDSCLSVTALRIIAEKRDLRLTLRASAGTVTQVKLPGPAKSWIPNRVLLDGAPSHALMLRDDGFLYLLLRPGVHTISLEGKLYKDELTLELGEVPKQTSSKLDGWTLAGLRPDGTVESTLQLTREVDETEQGVAATEVVLRPWFEVRRTVELGVTWKIQTTVQRITPLGQPVTLRVPLFTGEHVVESDILVESGAAVLSFGREVQQIEYASVLETSDAFEVTASGGKGYTEVWSLLCSPLWRCEPEGLTPVSRVSSGIWQPTFRPWPGERLAVKTMRPRPSPGDSLTVDQTSVTLSPGTRLLKGELALALRSSQGKTHAITLPPGSEVKDFKIDGIEQPFSQEDNRLSWTIKPGAQRVQVEWQEPTPIGSVFRAPAIDLGTPSVNVETKINLPENRWLLFAGGPSWGPAILFWGYLVVIVVLALILPRLPYNPLKSSEWLLLGLGFTQVDVLVGAVVILWFFALQIRSRQSLRGRVSFNLGQLSLVAATGAFFVCLVTAIFSGLAGDPDMSVEGAGSSRYLLRWYVDRSDASLPRPWLLTLPLWVWRVLMLAWALWLASRLVRWLKWGWECFSHEGTWRSKPKKKPVAPSPAPTP